MALGKTTEQTTRERSRRTDAFRGQDGERQAREGAEEEQPWGEEEPGECRLGDKRGK